MSLRARRADACCLECGGDPEGGQLVVEGSVCPLCWELLVRTATTRLCDRVQDLSRAVTAVHSMVVSRAVASALPNREDRLRVWFELAARGLGPSRSSGRRSKLLLALIAELRDLGVPQSITGQRHLPGAVGANGDCDLCGKSRQLNGRWNGELLCANCWRKHPQAVRPCTRCGGLEYLSRDRLCRACRGRDKIAALFTDGRVEAQPSLMNVRAALLAAEGGYLDNMIEGGTAWRLLRSLVEDENAITHEALDTLGSPSDTKVLRSFLIAHRVLPTRDDHVRAFETWIERSAQTIARADDRKAFIGFARWRHLRQARQNFLTEAQRAWRRRELTIIRELLAFLHDLGLGLRTATQSAIDQWLAQGNSDRRRVRAFLYWCRTNAVAVSLRVQSHAGPGLPVPAALLEHEQRALLRRILDPAQLFDPGTRLAAGLVLVYGFRVHQIAKLRLEDITLRNGSVSIRFGPDPLHLPPVLGEYARQARNLRTITRFGGADEDHEWLYPSPIHGQPVTAASLSRRLTAIGLSAEALRGTALGQLALQLPPAVLARLTGLSKATATRWYATVSAGNARIRL